jgi:hypothetical protein
VLVHHRTAKSIVLALLAAALIALLLPALAAAEKIVVDSPADEPLKGGVTTGCETAAGKCTLRAAIERANARAWLDEIEFSVFVFSGRPGTDEIQLTSALEPITDRVLLYGHPIGGGPFVVPNVGVIAPPGETALTVDANFVAIESIAFGGGESGIQVSAGKTGFVAHGNWFGMKLDGTTGNPVFGPAIVLGPGADGATIGGEEMEDGEGGFRNVFANAETGVEVKGASKAKIQGNYFGVRPAGDEAESLEIGIRILDAGGAEAKENEVGGVLTPGEAQSVVCDGFCNVIATEEGQGVELSGPTAESAATGPTQILGNYIGLKPDGTGPIGANADGVRAAPPGTGCSEGPADVTVGGLAATETNYIAGGSYGIYAEAAQNFSAIGNAIGIAPDGSAIESPQNTAIGLCNAGVTEPSLVAGNRMVLGPDTFGVEVSGGQAQIVGNSIEGGFLGILTNGAETGGGSVITSNTITETDVRGIEIEDDFNVVAGNTIARAGGAAIQLDTDADHNRIGGDEPGEPNTIVESRGTEPEDAAIMIFGRQTGRNEVAANTGFGNPGAFITLIGHGGSERPNGGIQPPALVTVSQSSATGTAQPGATVRLFSKASAEPGELGGLLAVAKADSAGNWSATYATQAVGGLVAATQTSDAGTYLAGTSEVSAPVAASADPLPPPPVEPEKPNASGSSNSGGGSTNSPPPTSTPKAPKVKITAGPKKSSTAKTAKFRFKAEPAAGAKFECKLDNAKWAKCASPKTYKNLKVGQHTFRVRATANGPTSATAVYKFKTNE